METAGGNLREAQQITLEPEHGAALRQEGDVVEYPAGIFAVGDVCANSVKRVAAVVISKVWEFVGPRL